MLAAVGVYGLFACAVAQRTREMGVRLALGATAAALVRLVLMEGAIVGVAGLTAGLSAAFAAAEWVRSVLPGASRPDLTIFASAAAVLLAAALAACWIPARRAGRADPADVLRAEYRSRSSTPNSATPNSQSESLRRDFLGS
jgi:ABC-type antimicrobial peptide transport system permease subunit